MVKPRKKIESWTPAEEAVIAGVVKRRENWTAIKTDLVFHDIFVKLRTEVIKAESEGVKVGQRPDPSKQGLNKVVQPSYGARAPESWGYDELLLLKLNFDRFKEFDSVSIVFYFEPHKSEWIPYEEKIQAAIKNAFKSKTGEIEVFNNGNPSLINLHRMYEVDPFSHQRRLIAWIDKRRGVCIPKGVKFNGGDDFMKVLKKLTLQGNDRFPVCYPLSWDDPELTPHKDMLVKKWGQDITGIGAHLFDSSSVTTLERALKFASISEEDSVLGWFSSTGKEIRSVLLNGFNSTPFCLSAYAYPHMWNSLPTDDKGRRTLLLCKFKKGMITDKHFKVRDENGSELTYPAEAHILPVAVFVFKEGGEDDYQEMLVSISKIVDTFGKYLKQTPEIPPEVQDLAIHYQSNKSMFIEELLKLQNDTSVLKFLGSLDSLKEVLSQEKTQTTTSSNDEVDLDNLMDANRIAALKKRQKLIQKGHGEYREITEGEFLGEVTGTDTVICHFYHREAYRCKIMDTHLEALAPKYASTKFLRLDAENAPAFVAKYGIKTLPCVLIFRDGTNTDRLAGFQDLGERDDFSTNDLKRQLLLKKGIDVEK